MVLKLTRLPERTREDEKAREQVAAELEGLKSQLQAATDKSIGLEGVSSPKLYRRTLNRR